MASGYVLISMANSCEILFLFFHSVSQFYFQNLDQNLSENVCPWTLSQMRNTILIHRLQQIYYKRWDVFVLLGKFSQYSLHNIDLISSLALLLVDLFFNTSVDFCWKFSWKWFSLRLSSFLYRTSYTKTSFSDCNEMS